MDDVQVRRYCGAGEEQVPGSDRTGEGPGDGSRAYGSTAESTVGTGRTTPSEAAGIRRAEPRGRALSSATPSTLSPAPADVAILIPTRGRVDRLGAVIANAQHPDATVYLIVEPDEYRHYRGAVALTREGGFGKYSAAANFGYRATPEPLIFSAADDLCFHDGWLETARDCLSKSVMVVGTNDLGNPATLAGESSTHHLIDRRYLDEFGGVFDEGPGSFLCESYDHNYNDTEFIATAQRRGAWVPCLESVVEHMHPLWGKAQHDATYARSFSRVGADTELFVQRREALWRI